MLLWTRGLLTVSCLTALLVAGGRSGLQLPSITLLGSNRATPHDALLLDALDVDADIDSSSDEDPGLPSHRGALPDASAGLTHAATPPDRSDARHPTPLSTPPTPFPRVAAAPLAGPLVSEAKTLARTVSTVSHMCVLPTGEEVLLGGQEGSTLLHRPPECRDTFPYRHRVVVPGSLGEVVYHRDVTYWTGIDLEGIVNLSHFYRCTVMPLYAVWLDMIGLQRHVVMSASVTTRGWANPLADLLTPDGHPMHLFKPNVTTCFREAYYGYPVLGWPEVNLHLFALPQGYKHFELFRRRVLSRWGHPEAAIASLRPLPLVVLNVRKKVGGSGFGRNLTNANELKAFLASEFAGRVEPVVLAFEDYPLQRQVELVQETSVMIGPHGGGLGWALAMRPGTVLVELFPYGAPYDLGVNLNPNDSHIIVQNTFSYVTRRLNVTYVRWVSPPKYSPDIPPSEWMGRPFGHWCKPKRRSKYRWRCRNVVPPNATAAGIVGIALEKLGRFDGAMSVGLGINAEDERLAYAAEVFAPKSRRGRRNRR